MHVVSFFSVFQKDPVFGTDIDHHRFKSLPAISNRVGDLSSLEVCMRASLYTGNILFCICTMYFVQIHGIRKAQFLLIGIDKCFSLSLCQTQFKPTLSQLHADLKSFEHHFEWLNRITRKQHHSSIPKLTDMISHIKSLINALQRQVKCWNTHTSLRISKHYVPMNWKKILVLFCIIPFFNVLSLWTFRWHEQRLPGSPYPLPRSHPIPLFTGRWFSHLRNSCSSSGSSVIGPHECSSLSNLDHQHEKPQRCSANNSGE